MSSATMIGVALSLAAMVGTARPVASRRLPLPPADPAITYTEGNAGNIWVMNADGSNKQKRVTGATGGASWTPDGQKLVFRANLGTGHGVHVHDLASNTTTKILSTPNDWGLKPVSVSPGPVGTTNPAVKIATCIRDVGQLTGSLFIFNLDGSGVVKLTNPIGGMDVSWGPGSNAIATTEFGGLVTYDLLETGGSFAVTNRTSWTGTGPLAGKLCNGMEWGPTGAIAATFTTDTTGTQIWILPAPGAAFQVTSGSSTNNYWGPSWNPDGTKLVLRRKVGRVFPAVVLNLATLQMTQLTKTTNDQLEWRGF